MKRPGFDHHGRNPKRKKISSAYSTLCGPTGPKFSTLLTLYKQSKTNMKILREILPAVIEGMEQEKDYHLLGVLAKIFRVGVEKAIITRRQEACLKFSKIRRATCVIRICLEYIEDETFVLKSLWHDDPLVRVQAIDTLVKRVSQINKIEQVQDRLMQLMHDWDLGVRVAAVRAFIRFGEVHSVEFSMLPDFLSLLADPVPDIRRAALGLLRVFATQFPDHEITKDIDIRPLPACMYCFFKICDLADDRDPHVRAQVFKEIPKLPILPENIIEQAFTKKAKCDLELLSRRGQSSNDDMREVACLRRSAPGAFVHALDDEKKYVRAQSMECLVAVSRHYRGLLSTISLFIVELLNDEHYSVRELALRHLRTLFIEHKMILDKDLIPILLVMLSDSRWQTRKEGYRILEHMCVKNPEDLKAILHAVCQNVRKFDAEIRSMFRVCKAVGKNHPRMVEMIAPEITKNMKAKLESKRFTLVASVLWNALKDNPFVYNALPKEFYVESCKLQRLTPEFFPSITEQKKELNFINRIPEDPKQITEKILELNEIRDWQNPKEFEYQYLSLVIVYLDFLEVSVTLRESGDTLDDIHKRIDPLLREIRRNLLGLRGQYADAPEELLTELCALHLCMDFIWWLLRVDIFQVDSIITMFSRVPHLIDQTRLENCKILQSLIEKHSDEIPVDDLFKGLIAFCPDLTWLNRGKNLKKMSISFVGPDTRVAHPIVKRYGQFLDLQIQLQILNVPKERALELEINCPNQAPMLLGLERREQATDMDVTTVPVPIIYNKAWKGPQRFLIRALSHFEDEIGTHEVCISNSFYVFVLFSTGR